MIELPDGTVLLKEGEPLLDIGVGNPDTLWRRGHNLRGNRQILVHEPHGATRFGIHACNLGQSIAHNADLSE